MDVTGYLVQWVRGPTFRPGMGYIGASDFKRWHYPAASQAARTSRAA